ncbi:MAG: sugar nucleotide-binding protein, partial [Halothiobacillus sp.]
SWHHYAEFVIHTARAQGQALKVNSINPIPSSQYPTPAQRPHNSRLNTHKIEAAFGITLPHWQAGVARMLEEIKTP